MSVQYTWGMSSTPTDFMSTVGGRNHEDAGGCSIHRVDIMSTPGGYHDKCG